MLTPDMGAHSCSLGGVIGTLFLGIWLGETTSVNTLTLTCFSFAIHLARHTGFAESNGGGWHYGSRFVKWDKIFESISTGPKLAVLWLWFLSKFHFGIQDVLPLGDSITIRGWIIVGIEARSNSSSCFPHSLLSTLSE